MRYIQVCMGVCIGLLGASMALAATSTPQIVSGMLSHHTLAIRGDGTLWSWGRNDHGQLGLGHLETQNVPQQVKALTDVIDIAGGKYYSLALKRDGTVWAWGRNQHGQLGQGDRTNRRVPTLITGLSDVVAIAAGEEHSIALKRDRTLWVWGGNTAGQLGLGDTMDRLTPQLVSTLTGVTAVVGGAEHTLVIQRDGTVWAWGLNDDGQLGLGDTMSRRTPEQIMTLSEILAVTAGGFYSLALHRDGTVSAWGLNTFGQLGLGTFTSTPHLTPQVIPGLQDIVAIAGGDSAVLALRRDGQVLAWGANNVGQLGLGHTTHQNTPQVVTGIREVTSLARGGRHSLVLRRDGSVWGWGLNTEGELGLGHFINQLLPVQLEAQQHVLSAFTPALFDLGTIARGALSGPQQVQFTVPAGQSQSFDFDPADVLRSGLQSLVRYTPGSCASGLFVGPQACTVQITSTAKGRVGLRQGLLTIPADGTFARAVMFPVVANVMGGHLWTALNEPYEFGVQALATHTDKTITVKNRGDADVTMSDLSISGSVFQVAQDTCQQKTLAPADSCSITVRFTPDTGGLHTETLTVRSDDPVSPDLPLLLSGIGDAPRLALAGQLNFGDVSLGSTRTSLLTLSNSGVQTLHISSITLAAPHYALVNHTCGATLDTAATCEIEITFTPTASGLHKATLNVVSDDPKRPNRAVRLQGTGIN